jgi:hypothetical protein
MTAFWYYVMGKKQRKKSVIIGNFLSDDEAYEFCYMLRDDAIDDTVFYVCYRFPE